MKHLNKNIFQEYYFIILNIKKFEISLFVLKESLKI